MAALCHFFARGNCKNGDSCKFVHQPNANSQPQLTASQIPENFPMRSRLFQPRQAEAVTTPVTRKAFDMRATVLCKYMNRPGGCQNPTCPFLHESNLKLDAVSHVPSDGVSRAHILTDSRGTIPCKFLTYPGGCKKKDCPYLHPDSDRDNETGRKGMEDEYEEQELDDDYTRELAGAAVIFSDFGHVEKVSLPMDFSVACITGFTTAITPQTVIDAVHGLGITKTVDSVNISHHPILSESKAFIKVEDPHFASEIIAKIQDSSCVLKATSVPIVARQSDNRKVHISWHKATRNALLYFDNLESAVRVSKKYTSGKYKCLGHTVQSTAPKAGSSSWNRNSYERSGAQTLQGAWCITLSQVPQRATIGDIERSIKYPSEKPRSVRLGPLSYTASDAEVSVEVRSRLETYGPLENFYFGSISKGKRAKATALFQDERHAKSACSLDNQRLNILGQGKLTVTQIHSSKVKISAAVYHALKASVDEENEKWKLQHLVFKIYPDPTRRFTTLKVEGEDAGDVIAARKTLDKVFSGHVLKDDHNFTIWDPILSSNGRAFKMLKCMEEELHVVLARDKAKREIRFYGPIDKLWECTRRTVDILKNRSSMSSNINLDTKQFTRTISGAFKRIEEELGKDIAVFNVISRSVTINGTEDQYERALAIIDGRAIDTIEQPSKRSVAIGEDCPICFCETNEADNPIQTSCNHTYCQECFEECCKAAASTSKKQFGVQCQGDGGTCTTKFTLNELKELLSSPVFESMLNSSFEQFIQRHPEDLRYCPTPDCGFIYRRTSSDSSNSLGYTCPNCLEPLCTSCGARHGEYTCAEYKDIASGGYKALEKLKKELNIKDCPKCSTPMEKTEGCNHMTCAGCKAHICWVCMKVFESSGPCYEHMNREHGGIGLDHLQRLAY